MIDRDESPEHVVIHAVFVFAGEAGRMRAARDLLRTLRESGCRAWEPALRGVQLRGVQRRMATLDDALIVDITWSWPDLSLTIWGHGIEPRPGALVERLARGLRPRQVDVWFGE